MLSFQHDGEARGYESIATTVAIGFTSTFYNYSSVSGMPMKAALITVETADIRFTLDSTTPTTTASSAVGHLITSGQNYVVRCINAVTASGAVVKATYFY
jgi:predicted tellurium resistance membrane protein TerC